MVDVDSGLGSLSLCFLVSVVVCGPTILDFLDGLGCVVIRLEFGVCYFLSLNLGIFYLACIVVRGPTNELHQFYNPNTCMKE